MKYCLKPGGLLMEEIWLGKLDYEINEVVDNHWADDKYEYNHIKDEVWFSNEELMNDVAEHFNLKLKLNTLCEIPKGMRKEIWDYVGQYKKYMGTYGPRYLNDM